MKSEAAYLSVREVADYLGISKRTAYGLVARGDIPSVCVGGQHASLGRSLTATSPRGRREVLPHEERSGPPRPPRHHYTNRRRD